MNCFKRLDEKVMARTFERQVAELNIRASILNNLPRWVRPRRSLLHNCIWGWGCLGLWPIYATTPNCDRTLKSPRAFNAALYAFQFTVPYDSIV